VSSPTASPDHPDLRRFERAVAAIDAANADDPNRIVVRGESRPKELAHAELMTEWVRRLRPDASESLRLAARAHHIRRWALPRDQYPEGRSGYLRWRRELHERHAVEVASILADVGYDDTTIARVRDIVRKRGLGRDPEVQAFEDALCLVFIETQFTDLSARLERDKMVDVVRKTLKKMSAEAQALVPTLDVPAEDRDVIEEAVRG
jgi:hypothetical protein